jgi:HSP20 family protein
MSTKALTKPGEFFPSLFSDFFKPWNEMADVNSLWGKTMTVPAVNVMEDKDAFIIKVAAPGLKKTDFNIDVDGNMLTVSCEKEEKKEEKDNRLTRYEYNFSSFSRSFTLPEMVIADKIEAVYDNGELKVMLPKKEEAKKALLSKHVPVK